MIIIKKTTNLDTPINVEPLNGVVFTQENQGHEFVIACYHNGEHSNLSGSISVRFMRADNQTVYLAPNASSGHTSYTSINSDGDAVVDLHHDCYNFPGRFQMVVFNTDGGKTNVIYACVGNVRRSQGEALIDSGEVIPTIDQLLEKISDCDRAAQEANAAANKSVRYDVAQTLTDSQKAQALKNIRAASYDSVAREFSGASAYNAGDFVIYDGNLYKFVIDHAAGGWTGTDAILVALGNDVDAVKNALSYCGEDIVGNRIYSITHVGMCFNSASNNININSPTSNPAWNSYLIPCVAGDVFTVYAVGGTTTYAYAFINESGAILSKSSSNYTANKLKITAPAGTAYLVVNDKGGESRVYSGELYKDQIEDDFAEVYRTIKTHSHYYLFYIANGAKTASWSKYAVSPPVLSLGSNNYFLTMDGTTYEITIDAILSAAETAGITVDRDQKTISHTSFVLYFDVNTHSPKVNKGMTNATSKTIVSNNPVIFAAHYTSFRGGLLMDYMFTHRMESAEADITTLQDDVTELETKTEMIDFVPSYFEENLSAKIPLIIANMNEAGANGTTFVFITDLHWETNYRNSPALVRRVLSKTNVRNVFCGGDLFNQGEKDAMAEVLLDCVNHFRFVQTNGFFPVARGNHDDNSNWTSSANVTAYAYDDNTIYSLLLSPIADRVTRIGSNWTFYFDQAEIKTRYIFVDTKRSGLTIDKDQIISCLNSVASGWHVVIVMHFTLKKNADDNTITLFAGCDLIAHIVSAYNNRKSGSYSGSHQTATYDFTAAAGTVDLIIGGHMHEDLAMAANDVENNPSGVPIIATDTDSWRNPDVIEGTVASQCFDVVTVNYSAKTVKCVRIGRGEDRNFTY